VKFPVLFLNPSPLWGPIPHSVDSFLIPIQWHIAPHQSLLLLKLVLNPNKIARNPPIVTLIPKEVRARAEVVLVIAGKLALFLMMRSLRAVEGRIDVFLDKRNNKEAPTRRIMAPIVQKTMLLLHRMPRF